MKKKPLRFKVHTPNLLREIANCALPQNSGVLKVPLNIFQMYLGKIADRCIEINDPILNEIMCDMTLYDEADPESKNYSKKLVNKVYRNANYFRKNNKIKNEKENR